MKSYDEFVKTAAVQFKEYKPTTQFGQFSSQAQKRGNEFMSRINSSKNSMHSVDDILKNVKNDARNAALERATVHGSPEYKALRNNTQLKDKLSRRAETASSRIKDRVERDIRYADTYGKRPLPSKLSSTKRYYTSQAEAKAAKDASLAADKAGTLKSMGNKALVGSAALATGIGAYKAYKKYKEKQAAKSNAAASQIGYGYTPAMMQATASYELDRMYFEKIAEDSASQTDLVQELPDLILESKYAPETKKEITPGGKVTPSKYVQRKNKQRYNA